MFLTTDERMDMDRGSLLREEREERDWGFQRGAESTVVRMRRATSLVVSEASMMWQ